MPDLTSKQIRNIREYFDPFEGLIQQSGIVRGGIHLDKKPLSKTIRTKQDIKIINGSFLKFLETLDFDDNDALFVTKYSYKYYDTDGTQIFRYDKDALTITGQTDYLTKADGTILWHPEHHLHIGDIENIRYKTHETSLEEILEFIKRSFI